MILPYNFEHKIGFAQLRTMLDGLCLSALGRHFVAKMHFQTNVEQLQKLLLQTDEFRQLLNSGADFHAGSA